jgi:hypothetical protein
MSLPKTRATTPEGVSAAAPRPSQAAQSAKQRVVGKFRRQGVIFQPNLDGKEA